MGVMGNELYTRGQTREGNESRQNGVSKGMSTPCLPSALFALFSPSPRTFTLPVSPHPSSGAVFSFAHAYVDRMLPTWCGKLKGKWRNLNFQWNISTSGPCLCLSGSSGLYFSTTLFIEILSYRIMVLFT